MIPLILRILVTNLDGIFNIEKEGIEN